MWWRILQQTFRINFCTVLNLQRGIIKFLPWEIYVGTTQLWYSHVHKWSSFPIGFTIHYITICTSLTVPLNLWERKKNAVAMKMSKFMKTCPLCSKKQQQTSDICCSLHFLLQKKVCILPETDTDQKVVWVSFYDNNKIWPMAFDCPASNTGNRRLFSCFFLQKGYKKDHRVVYINLRKSVPEGLKEK